ncbi:MAG: hypothetical protein OXD34_04500 [bacterium]|nr:hypothetical protein [bacterium]
MTDPRRTHETALAILFFTLWFRLFNLADSEWFSEADKVAWYLVAVLNPLVLGTVGAGLEVRG